MKDKKALHRFAIALMFLYLFMPLIATFLYSIATDWYDTVLPKGLTLSWYVKLFQDVRFVAALGRTLFACSVAVGLNIAVMVVSLFIVSLYLPKLERCPSGFRHASLRHTWSNWCRRADQGLFLRTFGNFRDSLVIDRSLLRRHTSLYISGDEKQHEDSRPSSTRQRS